MVVAVLAAWLGCAGPDYYEAYTEADPGWDPVFPRRSATLEETLAWLHAPRSGNLNMSNRRLQLLRTDVEPWREAPLADLREGRMTPAADADYALVAHRQCTARHGRMLSHGEAINWYLFPRSRLAAWTHYTFDGPCLVWGDFRPATGALVPTERRLTEQIDVQFPQTFRHAELTYAHGLALFMVGRIDEAEAALKEGDEGIEMPFWRELDKGKVSERIGMATRESTERARQALAERIRVARRASSGAAGDALFELAHFHLQALTAGEYGDFARGQWLSEQAVELYDADPAVPPERRADAIFVLAEMHRYRGDYPSATRLHRQALALRRDALGDEDPAVARSLSGLAKARFEAGAPSEAFPLVDEAMGIAESVKDDALLAELIVVQAQLLLASGAFEAARDEFERALSLQRSAFGSRSGGVALTGAQLAIAEASLGERKKAAQRIHRLFNRYEIRLSATNIYLRNLLALEAHFTWMDGDLPRAVSLARRSHAIAETNLHLMFLTGSEEQRAAEAAMLTPYTDMAFSMAFAEPKPETHALALETVLQRKGRVLAAARSEAKASRELSGEDRLLVERVQRLQRELAVLVTSRRRELSSDAFTSELQRIERALRDAEKEIRKRVASLEPVSEGVRIERVRQSLPDSGALIEFTSYRRFDADAFLELAYFDRFGPPRYGVCVLRRIGAPACRDLGTEHEIDDLVRAFRYAVSDPRQPGMHRRARALDEAVMRPVRSLLGDETVLFLSPDGMLNLVPFGAFVDEQGKYLIDRFEFTYLTTGRDLLRETTPSAVGPSVVIADPDFDARGSGAVMARTDHSAARHGRRSRDQPKAAFSRLVGTEAEGREVQALLGSAELLTGAEATEEAVKQVQSPYVLHLATHGFFLPDLSPADAPAHRRVSGLVSIPLPARLENPLLRSGLVLAGANLPFRGEEDGLLTALEVTAIDLEGTALVVLSACETGVGEVANGDGVYGLRRAFVVAGAATQVASLWRVPDTETAELIVSYYHRLAEGEGRSEALRNAQLEMRGKRAHPYFWAGFITLGARGPLPLLNPPVQRFPSN